MTTCVPFRRDPGRIPFRSSNVHLRVASDSEGPISLTDAKFRDSRKIISVSPQWIQAWHEAADIRYFRTSVRPNSLAVSWGS